MTPSDHARLSSACYQSREMVGEWHLARSFQRRGASSASCLYVHEDQARAILAYRGTMKAVDAVDDLLLLGGRVPRQWKEARNEALEAQALIPSDAELTLTGHSIGGAFAAAVAAEFEIPAVTFNAPGMFSALVHFFDRHRSPLPDWLRLDQPRIVNYRTARDWISTLSGPRFGREQLLDILPRPPSRPFVPGLEWFHEALYRHAIGPLRQAVARSDSQRPLGATPRSSLA